MEKDVVVAIAQAGRVSKDRGRKLFDRSSEPRNAAESVLLMAFHKMVENVKESVGAMIANMDRQQVHELMLEAWSIHPLNAHYDPYLSMHIINTNHEHALLPTTGV